MSSTSPTARRRARMPRLLRASQIVLIVGAVLCAAAAIGPLWAVRVGIGLAVATGVIAVVLAFRYLRQLRREHAARLLAMTRSHGVAMSTERQRNAEVVQVLTDRAQVLTEQAQTATETATKQQVRIGKLDAKVTELIANNVRLRGDVKSRDVTIVGLREKIRTQNVEIQLLRADLDMEAMDAPYSEVHGLPRHLRGEQNAQPQDESAADLWDDTDHPTVVDMRAVNSPLPNYEVDLDRKEA